MRFIRPGVAALLAWAACFAPNAYAEPLKLRMDWQVMPGHFPPIIPSVPKYGPGVYRHYGKSYIVEPVRLPGGGPTLTALAADQIEMSGAFSPQQLVLGTVEAKLALRVIGQGITTELPGYKFTHFWVRKNEIKKIEDLRGKVIALTARGGNFDAAIRIMMSRAGMQEGRDYQIAEVRLPNIIAALESKKIDAGPLVPPFDRMISRNAEYAPLFSVGDAFGPVETLMFGAKAEFVAKNRTALVDFLEDNIRMRRWMTDPKTRPDAVRQVSEISKLPLAELVEWVYTKDDYYFHPKALVTADRLQNNIDTMHKGGIIAAPLDVRPLVDNSLAEEAAARIKD